MRLDALQDTVNEESFTAGLDAGRHHDLLPQLEQAAQLAPGRERIHRLLAVALHRSARSADALAVLRRFRDQLVAETGLDPSPETDALQRKIISGDTDLQAPTAHRSPPPGGPPALSTPVAAHERSSPTQVVSAAPLVGREDDLRRLATALSTNRLVTVTGPGGVGKTRLAFAVAARTTTRGPTGRP